MRRMRVASVISIGLLLTLAQCSDNGAETNGARSEPGAPPSQLAPVKGTIVGVVLDAADKPLAERLVVYAVPVASVIAPPDGKHDPALVPIVVPPDADVMWSDDSAADGEFRIPDLPSGEYRLATKSRLWAVDPPVTVRPGDPTVRVRVVPAIGVAVSARNADDGSAIPNVQVALRVNVPGHRRIDLHARGMARPRWKVPDWVERSHRDAVPLFRPVRGSELPSIEVTVQAAGFLQNERTYVAALKRYDPPDRITEVPGTITIVAWLQPSRPANLEVEARTRGRPFVGDLAASYGFTVKDHTYGGPLALEHIGDGLYRGALPTGKITLEIAPMFGLSGPATVVDVTIRDGKTSTVRVTLPAYGSLRIRLREPRAGCFLVAIGSGPAPASALQPIDLPWKENIVLNVLPGTWTFMVWGPTSARLTATVDVVAGTETLLEVP